MGDAHEARNANTFSLPVTGLALDLEARLLPHGHVIQQLAAGPERRRVEARALDAADAPLAHRSQVHGPHRFVVVARRGVDDLVVVRRPARHEVFARALGDLLQLAVAQVERPDVVVAAERVAAVGRERDARAVVRVDRLAIVEGAPGQLALIGAVGIDRPDVVAAVAIGEEHDGAAVGRPHRLARIVEHVGDALHRAAGGRHGPDAALHVGGERLPVRRDRHGHRRAFAHGHVDLARARLAPRLRAAGGCRLRPRALLCCESCGQEHDCDRGEKARHAAHLNRDQGSGIRDQGSGIRDRDQGRLVRRRPPLHARGSRRRLPTPARRRRDRSRERSDPARALRAHRSG